RDVVLERSAAAPVSPDGPAVDVHLGEVVDAAEVEDDALALPVGGHGNRAMVPHRLDEVLVTDARELAFGAERDEDLAVEPLAFGKAPLGAGLAEVERKRPRAVEADPRLPHELRAR